VLDINGLMHQRALQATQDSRYKQVPRKVTIINLESTYNVIKSCSARVDHIGYASEMGLCLCRI